MIHSHTHSILLLQYISNVGLYHLPSKYYNGKFANQLLYVENIFFKMSFVMLNKH